MLIESLFYVGPGTWNKLPNNLKATTSVNCFKHSFNKYFFKKLSEEHALNVHIKRFLGAQNYVHVN